ncbi:MAG: hypothetical protein H6711_21750 [Myxococcales bacterium]|nr:hypothetical protein [Myxococcales bacterium]
MNHRNAANLLALPLTALLACTGGEETTDTADTADTADTSDTAGDCSTPTEVSGDIDADTTWSCDVILSGVVTVTNDAVLTIDPGVTVSGKSGSALVIAQGSRLEAAGTMDEPIVFTSSQAAGARNRGDWGGIVFLGRSYTNLMAGVGVAEGLENNAEYGGGAAPEADYNCGTLKYVRVEFAGFELTTDNELNGVTFYSCGTGTTVEYLQVHMGDDDGIEMFGGSWTGKNIVITGAADDSIDVDQGWAGTLTNIFIQQDPNDGNYAFEISNQDINLDASPRTAPQISMVTAIGGSGPKSSGIKFKEGGSGKIDKGIFMNFNGAQVDITEAETQTQADDGTLQITNSIFFNNAAGGGDKYVAEPAGWDIASFVESAAAGNAMDMDPGITDTTWGSPDPTPVAGGLAETMGVGAVQGTNWTAGWTNYAPN